MNPKLPAAERLPPQSRPLLVFMPGLDGTGLAFAAVRAALGDHESRVMAYPPEASGYGVLEEFVGARMPGDRPYLLIGESYAGPLAVSFAASRPANLVGVVLSTTFVRCPRPVLRHFRGLLRVLPARRVPARFLAPVLLGRYSTQRHIDLIDEVLAASSPPVLSRRLMDVATVDVTEQARRIVVPTLYLRARHDRVVPRSASGEVKSVMPTLEIAELDAPHLLLQVSAQAAAAEIRRFLSEVQG